MKIDAYYPKDLTAARSKYYEKLADHFVREFGSNRIRTILEAGCGRGELTIPLLRKLSSSTKMILVDSSKGPYSGWLNELVETLQRRRLERRVQVIQSDVRQLKDVKAESVDGIVSNELICDLPRKAQLQKALGEFYRILRRDGFMIHGEWSSFPTFGPGGLLIKHWPSWNPDKLFVILRDAGFDNFRVTYFDTTVHLGYQNSVEELRTWGWTERLIKRHAMLLKRQGLELPFEHLISCKKEKYGIR